MRSDAFGCSVAQQKRRKIETQNFENHMHFYDVFKQLGKDRARHTPPHESNKKRKKRSASKMKVQVVTINSVQESSKSELSSRGKRPFKVFRFSHLFRPQAVTDVP